MKKNLKKHKNMINIMKEKYIKYDFMSEKVLSNLMIIHNRLNSFTCTWRYNAVPILTCVRINWFEVSRFNVLNYFQDFCGNEIIK